MLIGFLFNRPEFAIWYAVFDRLQRMLPSNQDELFDFVDRFVGEQGEAAHPVAAPEEVEEEDDAAPGEVEEQDDAAPAPAVPAAAAAEPGPRGRARFRRGRSRETAIGEEPPPPRRRLREPARHRSAREAREQRAADLARLDALRPGRNPHIDGRGFAPKPKAEGRAKAKAEAKSEQITKGQPATLPYVDYKNESILMKPKSTTPVV